jgi:hypothetical protein
MTTFTNPSTQTTGHLVTAAEWNELVNNNKFFDETRYLELDIAESHPPLSGRPPAPIEVVESVGTPTCAWYQARFDAGTLEARQWSKPIPPEYKDTPQIVFSGYMATAVAGTIIMNAYVSAQSALDTTGTSRVFGTVNAATVAVPGTACQVFSGTITLTDPNGLAARDHAIFHIERFGTATIDNAGGDFVMTGAMFTYGI